MPRVNPRGGAGAIFLTRPQSIPPQPKPPRPDPREQQKIYQRKEKARLEDEARLVAEKKKLRN